MKSSASEPGHVQMRKENLVKKFRLAGIFLTLMSAVPVQPLAN